MCSDSAAIVDTTATVATAVAAAAVAAAFAAPTVTATIAAAAITSVIAPTVATGVPAAARALAQPAAAFAFTAAAVAQPAATVAQSTAAIALPAAAAAAFARDRDVLQRRPSRLRDVDGGMGLSELRHRCLVRQFVKCMRPHRWTEGDPQEEGRRLPTAVAASVACFPHLVPTPVCAAHRPAATRFYEHGLPEDGGPDLDDDHLLQRVVSKRN